MGQKDVEREKPLFEGQSAEEFIKRWNAITKAIKMRAEMPEHEKVVSMMSYDKASPNDKIGCSNSNDPEFLEKLVREGKTNREISLILDLDYGYVAQILSRYGIKRDPNRPCKRCGGPIGSTNPRQLYCKECQKAMDSIRARKSSMKKAEPKKCEYCGKDYFGQPGQKYCSKQCYKDAAASGKYKRPKNWIKRRDGKIDIEIRVCGKTTERRESVDYFEAREIWHRGWIGQGYAALVTVDGHRLETLPQIKTFFGFRRDSL